MTTPRTAYLSLGTNIGNKLGNLQNAIELLHEFVGNVLRISPVYQSNSWGFSGEDFLNICIKISTRYDAAELLQQILKIEKQLGRERNAEQVYKNRSIDIDILFFENEIIDDKILKVPHPFLQKRNFVLQPLHDIAPHLEHPVLKTKIDVLLAKSDDTVKVSRLNKQLPIPETSQPFKNYNYIAVEGNIGAGKTSFSTMVAQDFNAKLILERFKDNPFLPKFYEDQHRYAFSLEMSFLADRYQQLSEDLAQFDLFKDFIISDYDVFKSLIFAQITLYEDEYSLYNKLFNLMYKELPKPDLYIYLYQNTERLLQNIAKRGREYEQNIKEEYLVKINQGYLNYIKSQQHLNVKIIDISELDFIQNRQDYLKILKQI